MNKKKVVKSILKHKNDTKVAKIFKVIVNSSVRSDNKMDVQIK